MDVKILETMGQIAGISGIALGVVLLVFRDIIAKNIFPNLTKQQTYSLFKLLIILSWSIAILGIVTKYQAYSLFKLLIILSSSIAILGIGAWVYITINASTKDRPSTQSTSTPKIVDISFSGSSLDIKIKNSGTDSVYLSKLIFRLSLLNFRDHCCYMHMNFSYTYGVSINFKSQSSTKTQIMNANSVLPENGLEMKPITLNISQIVHPKRADRFIVELKEVNHCFTTEYIGYIDIYYDGDNIITTKKLSFNLGGKHGNK